MARFNVVFEIPIIGTQVGLCVHATAVRFVIAERANVCAAIGIDVATLTVECAVLERSDVFIPSRPSLLALAVGCPRLKPPDVCAAIAVSVTALTVWLIICERANIDIASKCRVRAPSQRPLTGLNVALKAANIGCPIRKGIAALAVEFVVAEVPNINVARKLRATPPSLGAATRLHIIQKRPNICAAVARTIGALTIQSVILKRTDIYVTRQFCAGPPGFCALPGLYTGLEGTAVYVAIRFCESTLPVLFVISPVAYIFTAACRTA